MKNISKILFIGFVFTSSIFSKDKNIASPDTDIQKGIYLTLEELITNSPSVQDSAVFLNRTSETDKQYFAEFELRKRREKKLPRRYKEEFSGYCDGERVFILDRSKNGFKKPLKEVELYENYSLFNSTINKVSYPGASSGSNSMMEETLEKVYYIIEMKKIRVEVLTPVLVKHLLLRENPQLYSKFSAEKSKDPKILAKYIRLLQN